MSFSLSAVAGAVANAFTVAEDVVEAYNKVKPYVTGLMDVAESTYAGAEGSGQTKLAAVLAAVKAVAVQIGVDWTEGLQAALTALISAAKAAYNAVVDVAQSVAA